MHEPQVVLGMVFMAHQHAPEVVQPGEEPFHLPATFVSAKWAAILSFGPFAVRSVGRDQLDPYGSERHVEGIAIVGLIADQPFGALGGKARSESVWDQGDFMRRSRCITSASLAAASTSREVVPTPGPPFLPRQRCRR